MYEVSIWFYNLINGDHEFLETSRFENLEEARSYAEELSREVEFHAITTESYMGQKHDYLYAKRCTDGSSMYEITIKHIPKDGA